jgi:glycosyltransferase involved in cell wall biosynthesis
MKILTCIGAYGRQYMGNEISRELLAEFTRRGHTCLVYAGVTPGELQGEPVSYDDGPIHVRRQLCYTKGRARIPAEIGGRILHSPRFLPLLQGLRRLLREHPDVDVIHVDAVYPMATIVALAALGHRAPIVPSVHGGDLMDYPGYGYGRYRLTRQLIRWTFGRSALLRVNSPLMGARARELGCDPEKIRHIPVNIGNIFFEADTPLAERRAAARQAIRERNGMAPDAPLLLGLGRLLPLKGFHDLIAAMPIVAQSRPDTLLIIAGPNRVDEMQGDQREALRRAIAQHGVARQVQLRDSLDYTTEMRPYLAAADLFLAPAHIDGMNRNVAEAGSQGTPSLVSATTGIAPTVRRWNAGVVVEARDVPALGKAIADLLDAPEELARYGANAQRMAQRFRSAVIADELLELYQEAITRHAQAAK